MATKKASSYGKKKTGGSQAMMKVKDNRQCVKAGTVDAKKAKKG